MSDRESLDRIEQGNRVPRWHVRPAAEAIDIARRALDRAEKAEAEVEWLRADLHWYGKVLAGGGPVKGYSKAGKEAEDHWYDVTLPILQGSMKPTHTERFWAEIVALRFIGAVIKTVACECDIERIALGGADPCFICQIKAALRGAEGDDGTD